MRERLVWGGLGVVLLLVVAAGAWSSSRGGAPIDDYGRVPDFELTERSGRVVTRADLAGDFWIANFIFTRCDGVCPLLTSRMAKLSRRLESSDVRFVSFTVDPSHDTPEILRDYALAAGTAVADPRRLFLTGSRDALHRLIGDGFRLNVAESPEPVPVGERITHSDRFVLVDPDGVIRGYYHGTDEESIERLVRDLTWMSPGFPRSTRY